MSAPRRVFFSTGEPSGELAALALGEAMREQDAALRFSGIGAAGMRAAGWELYADHTGWASLGPLAAIPRIPKLLREMWKCARDLAAAPPDLVVLVDFGAFNVRLAKELRDKYRYLGPILYLFPPGAWLDDPGPARAVAARAFPLTGFAHQAEFYRSHHLPIAFFGHPLAPRIASRAQRAAPPSDGGTVALLPGSRRDEIARLAPRLRDALVLVRRARPRLRARVGAADARARSLLERAFRGVVAIDICDGLQEAIGDADAAWVASGTAVLETTLSNVPTIALYAITPLLARHARRLMRRPYITLPNLILEREAIPEFLQERATPKRLAEAMERILRAPDDWYRSVEGLRDALGPADALERCARYALSVARQP
ncbi:MAG: hypothetical protein HKL92_02205 [Candidatus Eremiobacteraeota bacterium]|nr:hypothetical protein [Candidatus Eremiobacteraeota bacterium]NNM92135.1 hypothetical protein [Candidatus Eremiobacteraeota bacterium]